MLHYVRKKLFKKINDAKFELTLRIYEVDNGYKNTYGNLKGKTQVRNIGYDEKVKIRTKKLSNPDSQS